MRKHKNGYFYSPVCPPKQQVNGRSSYLGIIQSSLLNPFHRRNYLNGAHMGFIFYATDPNLSEEDEEALKNKIASSKGIGNFRSMFVNLPNGKEQGIQLIPVGDIATKDEFERIKNITAQDIFVGHHFPTGMGGMPPKTGSTIPDPLKESQVYDRYEVIPVCKRITDAVNNEPEIPKHLNMQFLLDV